jgi:D-alanyl-D-alanine carboxypeptidase (penicillin-binding protein 5/6)
MLESHNDTAVCIAESIDGSVEAFAARMNRKAGEIGCRNTYYITPNGLDAEDEEGIHHTTAYDLALVMRYCLTASPQKDAFLEVTRTASYAFTCTDGSHSYSCSNHNAFLSMMDGALSGKTGFTGNAGYCYVGALMRDDRLYIVSLLGCGWPGHKGYKWVDTKKLMTYGLNNYTKHELTIPDLTTPSITVTDGQQTTLPTYIKQENVQQILMQEDEQIEVQIRQQDTVRAPVEADSQVGVVQYLVDGTIYAEYPILTQSGTGLRNYPYCLRQIVSTYLLSSE